jgi:hypothetical protein
VHPARSPGAGDSGREYAPDARTARPMTGSPSTSGARSPRADPSHRTIGTARTLEDADLIARYRRVLRLELADTLAELRPGSEPGLFGPNDKRPALGTRRQLVDMAATIVRALVSPVELPPEPAPPGPTLVPRRRPRAGRVDFGGS